MTGATAAFCTSRANPEIKISISADIVAMHGDVIAVLDKVRSAGITKIGYQIKPQVLRALGPRRSPGAPPPPAPKP